jgi:hypothetical protein
MVDMPTLVTIEPNKIAVTASPNYGRVASYEPRFDHIEQRGTARAADIVAVAGQGLFRSNADIGKVWTSSITAGFPG